MDTDKHQRQRVPSDHAQPRNNPRANPASKPGDDPLIRATLLHFDRIAHGDWECRAYDDSGALLVTFTGHLLFADDDPAPDDPFDFSIHHADHGERQLLPVRSFRDASADPHRESVGFGATHRHRHTHPSIPGGNIAHTHPHVHTGHHGTVHTDAAATSVHPDQ